MFSRKAKTTPATDALPDVLPDALAKGLAEIEEVRATHAEVVTALAQARGDVRTLEGQHEAAIARLSSSESNTALTGDATGQSAARAEFVRTRDELDYGRARLRGLESRLKIIEVDALEAQLALDKSWDAYVCAEVETIGIEYAKAAEQYLHVVDRALAVAAALSVGDISLAMRRTLIPRTVTSRGDLIGRRAGFRTGWQAVPEAADLHARLLHIRQTVHGGAAVELPADAEVESEQLPRNTDSRLVDFVPGIEVPAQETD